jgi:hypothetical protein
MLQAAKRRQRGEHRLMFRTVQVPWEATAAMLEAPLPPSLLRAPGRIFQRKKSVCSKNFTEEKQHIKLQNLTFFQFLFFY